MNVLSHVLNLQYAHLLSTLFEIWRGNMLGKPKGSSQVWPRQCQLCTDCGGQGDYRWVNINLTKGSGPSCPFERNKTDTFQIVSFPIVSNLDSYVHRDFSTRLTDNITHQTWVSWSEATWYTLSTISPPSCCLIPEASTRKFHLVDFKVKKKPVLGIINYSLFNLHYQTWSEALIF